MEYYLKDRSIGRYDTICKECRKREAQEYRHIPEVHERILAHMTEYNSRPDVKYRQKEWREKPEVKEKLRIKANSPEVKAYQSQWWKSPKAKAMDRSRDRDAVRKAKKAAKRRPREMLKKYGLSMEKFLEIIEEQHGRCPICREKYEAKGRHKPVPDHCHVVGHVRSVICNGCNLIEGLLGSVETARRMLTYMESNSLFYASANTGTETTDND